MDFVLSSCDMEHETATVNPMAITNDCLNLDELLIDNWQTDASPASTTTTTATADFNNVVYTPTYSCYSGDFNETPTPNSYQSVVNSPQSFTIVNASNVPNVCGVNTNINVNGDNDSDSGIYSSSSSNSPKHHCVFENFEGSNTTSVYSPQNLAMHKQVNNNTTDNFILASCSSDYNNSYINIDMNHNKSSNFVFAFF